MTYVFELIGNAQLKLLGTFDGVLSAMIDDPGNGDPDKRWVSLDPSMSLTVWKRKFHLDKGVFTIETDPTWELSLALRHVDKAVRHVTSRL